MKTIKELINQEMLYENRQQSKVDQKNIIRRYEELNIESKNIIDDMFISICGYGLDTLIKRSEELNENV